MAFTLTYTSLSDAIQQYTQRQDDDFINNIPMFIMLAERRISRDLNILGLLKFVTGNLTAGNNILQKPSVRWLKTSSFMVGFNQLNQTGYNSQRPILNRENSFLMYYWPNFQETGEPLYYGDYEYNYFLIVPTPADAYPYVMSYYEVPELLDDSVSTNFLSTYDPDILLAGSLIEAFMYLKNYTWAADWERKYHAALTSMGVLNENLKRDSTDARGS